MVTEDILYILMNMNWGKNMSQMGIY